MPDESTVDLTSKPISFSLKPDDDYLGKFFGLGDSFEVPASNVHITFKKEAPMHDPITSPSHYEGQGGAEAKDVMRDYFGDEFMAHYWLGCALKYLFRYKGKNGEQDLLKAKQCIDYLIEVEYGDND